MNRQTTFVVLVILSLLPLGCGSRAETPIPKRVVAEKRVLKSESGRPESGRPEIRADRIPVEALPAVSIAAPKPQEVIEADVYDAMVGVVGPAPAGTQLWIFARNKFGVFLQYPPPSVNRKQGEWRQFNVRLATEGRDWDLVVCLATAEASRQLHQSARRGEWSFPSLPEGVEALSSVAVERKKSHR